MSKILAIDASRCKSGGAINHIVNIIKYIDFNKSKFTEIHIWTYSSLLSQLPNSPRIHKHKSIFLDLPLPFQLFWQALILKFCIKKYKCDLLFTADSSTLCNYGNNVVLNQDLLAFEKDIYQKMPLSFPKLRIIILRFLQKIAFINAKAVIFLSEYSRNKIIDECEIQINSIVIPHGVDQIFKNINKINSWDFDVTNSINCLYISPIFEYKNQLEVVKSVYDLRKRGYEINLSLVGGGSGYYYENLLSYIETLNDYEQWLEIRNFIKKNQLVDIINKSDIFIFASSCETFGITLLEAMSAGMPIVCSKKSSLPEILLDGGSYFDPKNVNELMKRLEELILDKNLRLKLGERALEISKNYTWQKCSYETFHFLEQFS
jgi:glycosyltransferase involved in cell wall biosynthesis